MGLGIKVIRDTVPSALRQTLPGNLHGLKTPKTRKIPNNKYEICAAQIVYTINGNITLIDRIIKIGFDLAAGSRSLG